MSGVKKIQNYNYILIIMVSVFFSGLFINLLIKKGMDFGYLYISFDNIKKSVALPVVSSFIVLMLKRIKQIIVIIVMMKLFNPETIYNITLILFGVLYGVIMSVQSYFGGINAVGVFLISVIPHYFLYYLCLDLSLKFFKGKVFNKNKIRFISVIFMLTALGVFFEENFLKIFLK